MNPATPKPGHQTTPLSSAPAKLNARVARVFNHAISASAIAAADELGLLDHLAENREVSLGEFCTARGIHKESMLAVVRAIACIDVVRADSGDTILPGEAFEETLAHKGYFLWLIRGYGGMLRELASVSLEAERVGDFLDRDGDYIAMAGTDYGARFVDSDFASVVEGVTFNSAADLGCGNAERLIRLAIERPRFRGLGVEFNADAVDRASARVKSLGLEDRITITQGDVSRLEPEPDFSEIDMVFSFFMAHDLWPEESCITSLNGVARAFPNAGRFLLCDTYRSDLEPPADLPIFTLGFEVTHAVMGQYVPSRGEWVDLFQETVWTLSGQHPVGIPFSCIFDLTRDVG